MDKLISKLEYILFISGEPIKKRTILSILDISSKELEELVEMINDIYQKEEKGIYIKKFDNYYQFATNNLYLDIQNKLLSSSRSKFLGKVTLEVLATIAYKQPITRPQIEEIRGVKSDYSVKTLLQRGLIEECGVLDVLGSPKLYRTTPLFLRNFGMDSLKELPEVEE